MSSISLKNNTLISLLFAVFLITSVNVEHGMGFSAILILLVSIVGLIATRGQDYPPLQAWEKYWLVSLFFFVGLIYVDIPRGFGDISDIDSQSRILLTIPVFLYVRRIGINLNIVLIGAAIATIVTGLYAWYQYVELGIRVHGITNAVYYGDIVTILFVLSVYGILQAKNTWVRFLMFIAAIFGLYAALLSGTRGSWITIPSLMILLFTYNVWNISLFKRVLATILFLIILVGVYQAPSSGVKNKVNQTIENVSAYFSEHKMSSIGHRLEMWKTSWLIAKNDNFLGNGPDDYRSSAQKIVDTGQVNKGIARFAGPHNQYFESLVNEGIFGLISLFAIFFIPIRIALKILQDPKSKRIPAFIVITILLMYMEFMLSVSALVVQIMSLFFAFSISIFLGWLVHNRHYS
jgi:O-antigen ligase